jgi:epsilon-lactone hydrolase
MVSARDHGLPLPAEAFLMSPYADLTLSGATMDTKSGVAPVPACHHESWTGNPPCT